MPILTKIAHRTAAKTKKKIYYRLVGTKVKRNQVKHYKNSVDKNDVVSYTWQLLLTLQHFIWWKD